MLSLKLAAFQQFFSFGIVGVLTNLFGYGLYLLLTWSWLDPKVAVSFLYPIGAIIGYLGHSRFAFSYTGTHERGISRYLQAHFLGYLTNLSILYVFTDLLGYPHSLIQAIAVFAVAGVLFVLFRHYVFSQRSLT
jgi:putative flippase GtrA